MTAVEQVRAEAATALRDSVGPLSLVGQPGVGKTGSLQRLLRDGLFRPDHKT